MLGGVAPAIGTRHDADPPPASHSPAPGFRSQRVASVERDDGGSSSGPPPRPGSPGAGGGGLGHGRLRR